MLNRYFHYLGFAEILDYTSLLFVCNKIFPTFAVMKNLPLFILFLASVILLSCRGERYPKALVCADSIADVDPLRATAILDSLSPTMKTAGEAVRNYYALLRIKAADKADRQLLSDSTVFRLVNYYERHGDDRLLPMAYYYAGRTLLTRNNAPEALDYYQKALALSEKDVSLLRLRACIYNQMGYVFFYQKLHSKSLEMAKNAYYCNLKLNDTIGMLHSLNAIAGSYSDLNIYDSAEVNYKRALNLARIQKDRANVVDISSELAYLYLDMKGKIDSAKRYLDFAIINNEGEKSRTLLGVSSKVYSALGMYDSAYSENILLLGIDNIYAKKMACREIAKYKMWKGDYPSAISYMEKYEDSLDSIDKITATEAVARMNAMYNYSSKEKEVSELNTKNAYYERLLIFFITALCVIILIIITSYIAVKSRRLAIKIKIERGKRVEKEMYEKSDAYIKEKENELAQLRQDISKKRKAGKDVAEQEEKYYKLHVALELIKIEETEHRHKQTDLKESDISKKIGIRLNDDNIPNKRLTEEEWLQVENTVCSKVGKFRKYLEETCKISEQEYKICLLLKLEIPPSDIAKVTNKTKAAISLTRKRLYHKIFGLAKSPEDLDRFILSL